MTKKPRNKPKATPNKRDHLDALQTTSYAQWAKALTALREHLDAGSKLEITELDLLMIMRPYLWWRHNPGFAEVMATCEAAMPVFVAHVADFGAKGKAVGTFLATYLDDGTHDGRADEMAISVSADKWAAKLKGSEADAMRALAKLMHGLYEHKHVAYAVLRHVGSQQVAALGSLIHGLPPADQAFILHALDGSLTQPAVRRFYKDFIATTPYPDLVKEAQRYAGLI